MTHEQPRRPAYDPELESSLLAGGSVYVLDFTPEVLAAIQADVRAHGESTRSDLEAQGLVVQDMVARAADGHDIPLHHIYAAASSSPRPCVFYIHGGGMVLGTPWDSASDFTRWIDDFGASVVTVDYRLAPHVKAPVLVEDCYRGLLHVVENARALGIDPDAIIVAGMSAGGGLAAGTALLARDRGGPALRGQLLLAPMLDPDANGDSARQVPDGPWNRTENTTAWSLVLDGVDPHDSAANTPGRREWLGELPPTLLEVGSAELFRTEVVEYANRIWRVGGNAELHVWSGGFHGFGSYPHAAVTQAAIESRRNWLGRMFGYGPQEATAHERPSSSTRTER